MYRVLLADDEHWALLALRSLIDWESCGFTIIGEEESGERALLTLEQEQPELVISDIRMPGMDGLALLRLLREKKAETEVLFVSGYTDFEYAREALRYGCHGYLVKPVEEKELTEYLSKIRTVLNRKREQREKEGEKEGFQSENVLVRRMMQYLRDHYAEGITLQVLAGEFGMSENYISSLIKKETGRRFSEHLTEIRIRRAQELLRSSNGSIEQIAGKVGYPDYFYFTKVYKKVTGLSPAAFRKQL